MDNDDVEQCVLPWKHDPSAESFPDCGMIWANHVIAGNESCILIIQLIFFSAYVPRRLDLWYSKYFVLGFWNTSIG